MFTPVKNLPFYLCQYNFDMQRWEWIKRFENEQELITYLASCLRYCYFYYGENEKPSGKTIESTLTHRINYSGNDTGTSLGSVYFRDIMIIDQNNSIIDPRKYKDQVLRAFLEKQNRRYYPNRHRQLKNHKFRSEPVPGTGKRKKGWGRNVKHWFKSYREDRIPEHKAYVRKKAMVPNTWESEPFHHDERSWKHQTKCRHQWEKHKNKAR